MGRIEQNQRSNTIREYRQADFMIGNSCYWCASNLSSYYPAKCPSFNSDKVDSIPISEAEAYRVNFDRGVFRWNSGILNYEVMLTYNSVHVIVTNYKVLQLMHKSKYKKLD